MPGTAVVIGSEGRWHRMRSVHVTEEQAETAAAEYAHLAPTWAELTRGVAAAGDVGEDEMDEFTVPDLEDLPV
jgi:DNA segregation ATPase FtsK/SpoIIIE, S-DNA-T family